MKLLFIFVLPCLGAECAYKIWWYGSGGTRVSFLGNVVFSDAIACALELCSWFYRTLVFFLVCILFRLICCLQILRLDDFAEVFKVDSNVESVLKEHLRIRRHLRIISHRYRSFILWALICITASQFACLLMTTRANADVNLYHTGELAVAYTTIYIHMLLMFYYMLSFNYLLYISKIEIIWVIEKGLLRQPSSRAVDTAAQCD